MIRAFMARLLVLVEYLYLRAHGWDRVNTDRYLAPIDYPWRRKDPYARGHAVNAQKQLEREQRYERRRARPEQ